MRRRTIGIVSFALLANATLTSTATACLMTGAAVAHAPLAGADATVTAPHSHQVRASESADHHTPDTNAARTHGESTPPGESQQVPSCCKALAPCPSSAATAACVVLLLSATSAPAITALADVAPVSRIVAPDTPPPKA